MIGQSYNETYFPYKSFLTDMQISRLCKAFANGSPANIKLSKTQLSKMIQLQGFFLIFGLIEEI